MSRSISSRVTLRRSRKRSISGTRLFCANGRRSSTVSTRISRAEMSMSSIVAFICAARECTRPIASIARVRLSPVRFASVDAETMSCTASRKETSRDANWSSSDERLTNGGRRTLKFS